MALRELIVERAEQLHSVTELRVAVLDAVSREVGFDGAVFNDLHPEATVEPRTMIDYAPSSLEAVRTSWNVHLTEIAPVIAQMRRGEVGSISRTFSLSHKQKLTIYRLAHAPDRIKHDLQTIISVRQDIASSLCLMRRSGAGFRDREVAILQSILPTLSLLEAGVRFRATSSGPSEMPVALSAAERDLLSYTALGFTNREIAAALGVSHLTVRNRLIRMYKRYQVASRAELVGRFAGSNAPSLKRS